MNENRVNVSSYIWVAMVAVFLLVFGGVWLASSPRQAPVVEQPVAATQSQNYDTFDRSYTAQVPDDPPLPAAPVFGRPRMTDAPAPADAPPTVVVTPLPARPLTPRQTPQAKPAPEKKVTPRDMFPVGNIARDIPQVAHPYRQIAELFPSFEYEGRIWSATGGYVTVEQADLVETGMRLTTGQSLYTLSDDDAPEKVLFVQSEQHPERFAVYRAS